MHLFFMILITNYMPTKLFYWFPCVGRGSLLHLEIRSIVNWLENMDYAYNRKKNWPAKRDASKWFSKLKKQLITDSWMCANPNHIRQNVWKGIFFQDIIVTIMLLFFWPDEHFSEILLLGPESLLQKQIKLQWFHELLGQLQEINHQTQENATNKNSCKPPAVEEFQCLGEAVILQL